MNFVSHLLSFGKFNDKHLQAKVSRLNVVYRRRQCLQENVSIASVLSRNWIPVTPGLFTCWAFQPRRGNWLYLYNTADHEIASKQLHLTLEKQRCIAYLFLVAAGVLLGKYLSTI